MIVVQLFFTFNCLFRFDFYGVDPDATTYDYGLKEIKELDSVKQVSELVNII